MRWIQPELGKTRTITKFLIFPKTINGETRWLEKVTYTQVVVYNILHDTGIKWKDCKWVD